MHTSKGKLHDNMIHDFTDIRLKIEKKKCHGESLFEITFEAAEIYRVVVA